MTKFLRQFSIIAIALVMIGGFIAPQIAHAAPGLMTAESVQKAVETGRNPATNQPATDVDKDECSIIRPTTWGLSCFYGMIGRIIWFTIVPLLGWVLQLVGQVLDFALNLQFSSDFFRAPSILAGWVIIRDLCNMVFIFVLIWAGISTILNIGGSTLKKTITGVIIAALFINFSLYITRAIIDVSNVTTAWFVQGVKNIGGGIGVSDSVKKVLQMEKLIGSNSQPKKDAPIGYDAYLVGVALIVLNLVAIYVFFNVAFLFVARIVSFMFLLVTAPVGFVKGLGIGDLDDLASSWWDELKKQALMAPMFFLMLYLTLYIVDQIQILVFSAGAGTTDSVTGSSFSAANYFLFAIIVMMLLKCLSIAKSYSGKLGGQISGLMKGAVGLATGTLAMGTLGKAAGAVAGNARFQSWAARSGVVGEAAMKATMSTAGSSFGAGSSLKGLSKAGVPMGDNFKGIDKGYGGMIKNEVDARKKFAKDAFGKGPRGAANRQAYAEGLKGGLFTRVVKTNPLLRPKDTLGMMRDGALVGALNSIPGIEATNKLPGFKNVVGKTSDEKAGKDILEDADKEFAKEAGKVAGPIKDKMDKEIDRNPDIIRLEKESEKMEKEIDEKVATIVSKEKQAMDHAMEEQKSLEETFKKMNGGEREYDDFRKKVEEGKKKTAESKKAYDEAKKTAASPELADLKAKLDKKAEEVDAIKLGIINKQIEALEKEGVSASKEYDKAIDDLKEVERAREKKEGENYKPRKITDAAIRQRAIDRVVENGKKANEKDEAERMRKYVEKSMKEESGGGDKPKEGGGDGEKKK